MLNNNQLTCWQLSVVLLRDCVEHTTLNGGDTRHPEVFQWISLTVLVPQVRLYVPAPVHYAYWKKKNEENVFKMKSRNICQGENRKPMCRMLQMSLIHYGLCTWTWNWCVWVWHNAIGEMFDKTVCDKFLVQKRKYIENCLA